MHLEENTSEKDINEFEELEQDELEDDFDIEDDGISNLEDVGNEKSGILKKASEPAVYKFLSNANAACANFIVNTSTSLATIFLINSGISDPDDKINSGIGFMSIVFCYIMSCVIYKNQPFYKGLTAAQALLIQYQFRHYGKHSIFATCMLTGAIVMAFAAVKAHRLVKVSPTCFLLGMQICVGKLFAYFRLETHFERDPCYLWNLLRKAN